MSEDSIEFVYLAALVAGLLAALLRKSPPGDPR